MAAASTREGLRAEVAAAVAGKEAELSPSARLEVTCLHPEDFAHGNPVLACLSHFLFPPSGKVGCLCLCLLILGEENGGRLHS